jgi:hypothetical protein
LIEKYVEGAEGRSVDMEEDVVMTRLKVGETAWACKEQKG